MSLDNHKITEYKDNVKRLPDYPSDEGYTADDLRNIFDGRTDNEVKDKHNELINELKGIIEDLEAADGTAEQNAKDYTDKLKNDLEEGYIYVYSALYADVAFDADNACFAECDYNGNVIHETYATKDEAGVKVASIHDDLTSIIPKDGEPYIIKYHDMPAKNNDVDPDENGEYPTVITDTIQYRMKIGDGKTSLSDLPVVSDFQAGEEIGSMVQIDPTYDNGNECRCSPAQATGKNSFAQGIYTVASGEQSVAMNYGSKASGSKSFACNRSISNGEASFSANKAEATGSHSAAFGDSVVNGGFSFVSGQANVTDGRCSHAEGQKNTISKNADAAHAEGNNNTVKGLYAHAEGSDNIANAEASHAQGKGNTVDGKYAHAEGLSNIVSGEASHAGGKGNTVSGNHSFVYGESSVVEGKNSGSLGASNTVKGARSLAVGFSNIIDEGITNCLASGNRIRLTNNDSVAFGKYNTPVKTAPFVVGWGENNDNRNNILELTRSGILKIKTSYQTAAGGEAALQLGETTLTESRLKDVLGAEELNPPTDSKYFDIDYDGIISLKPAYRGHPDTDTYPYSVSDNGINTDGSLNHELPERIVIPEVIGDTAVAGFAKGMFYYNYRVKEIVLPDGVTELPDYFCRWARNLQAVHNTEGITKLGARLFQNTPIKKLLFPNLTDVAELSLVGCGYLQVVDIGNNITEIPKQSLAQCYKLSLVKGGGKVTTIGEQAFYETTSLKNLHFLSQVTSIGSKAFYSSRIQFEWKPSTECTYETYATPVMDNTVDYWSGVTYTACENPLNTVMNQSDPLWGGKITPQCETLTYGNNGCTLFSALHVHSGFSGKIYNHPDEFVAELATKGYIITDTHHPRSGDLLALIELFETLGYKTTPYKVNNEKTTEHYQDMCDALSRGAYILTEVSTIDNVDDQHVVCIYGINEIGEVLFVDSGMPINTVAFGETGAGREQLCYHMPYINLCGPKSDFIIVEKP